jgi:hypothetical protein
MPSTELQVVADPARVPASHLGRDLAWMMAIGLSGLVLRLAYALEYAGHPLGQFPWVDEGAYWSRAVEILGGGWLPAGPFYQDPLFPYVLAGLMRLVGPRVESLRVALACLGSLTPPVVYAAARIGLGRSEAIVAGILAACYGPLVFTDGLLEKEGIGALIAAGALALTALALARRRASWAAAAAGLAWGLLALVRANAIAVGPIGAAWWACQADAPAGSGRWRRPVLFLLGFAAAIAPATVVNAVVSRPREFLLTTWQAGPNFYIGNGPEATGTYVAPEFVTASPAFEGADYAAEASRRAGRSLSPGAVSRFWFAAGLARWRAAPAASARLLVRKLGLLLHDFEIPDNQSAEVVRLVAAPALGWAIFGFGWILPCAALGLARPGRGPFWRFLVLTTAVGLLSTAAFFVVGRYRVPWMPGLILLAAGGIVAAARWVAERRWRRLLGAALLLALPAAALAWRPLADPAPDRWGHCEIQLAMASLQAGRLGPAIDAFDDADALGVGPAIRVREILATSPIHDRLAALVSTRLRIGQGALAASDLERARWLRQLPESRDESRNLLEAALRSRPDDAVALRELGDWWLGQVEEPGARDRARALFERAVGITPAAPSAAVPLALLTADPRRLERLDPRREDGTRVRLARAALRSLASVTGSGR